MIREKRTPQHIQSTIDKLSEASRNSDASSGDVTLPQIDLAFAIDDLKHYKKLLEKTNKDSI